MEIKAKKIVSAVIIESRKPRPRSLGKFIKPEVVLFLLCFLLLFKDTIFSNNIASGGDFVNFQLSQLKFFKSSLINGEFPLWNPLVAGGVPTLLFASIFNPVNLLFIILQPDKYLMVYNLIYLGVGFYFMFRLLRFYSRSYLSSLFCSLFFVLSGFFSTRIFLGHVDLLAAASLIPAIFYFLEKYFESFRLRELLWISLLVAVQLFSGHLQMSYYTMLFGGVYFALLLIKSKSLNIKVLVHLFVSLILTICLSGLVLYPSLKLSDTSTRSEGVSLTESSSFALPIKDFKVAFFPWPFRETQYFEGIPFVSLYVFSLAIVGFVISVRKWKKAWFYLGLLVVVILFSSGTSTPFFEFFYKYLPGFGTLRAHTRSIVFGVFAISILASFGLDFMVSNVSKVIANKMRIFWLILGLMVLVLLLLGVKVPIIKGIFDRYYLYNYLLVLSGLCFGLFLCSIRVLNEKILLGIFGCFILLGYLWFDWDYLKPKDYQLTKVDQFVQSEVRKSDPEGLFKVWYEPVITEKVGHRPYYFGVADSENVGWNSFSRYFAQFKEQADKPDYRYVSRYLSLNKNLFNKFGVGFVLTFARIEDQAFERIATTDFREGVEINLYRYNQARPLVYLADKEGKLEILRKKNNEVSIDTKLEKKQTLVFAQVYDPNWQVIVDGINSKPTLQDKGLMSVDIEPGEHTVKFVYNSETLVVGLSLTLLGFLLFIILYLRDSKYRSIKIV